MPFHDFWTPIHQDLDLEELGGEITWVPPPVVTDNIVPWALEHDDMTWRGEGYECSPPFFFCLGGVEVNFLKLYIVLKWAF